jgi:error-prone DNA polymerase
MSLAIEAAKFTPDEADGLRKAMATFKNLGDPAEYRDKFVEGMVRRGYERDFATGASSRSRASAHYGFPESHAASFAKLVYVSAWIKWAWPDVFCAALINSQPMGFYQPAQLVRDAREHGVEVRAPDVLMSDWDCTLEAALPPPSWGRFRGSRRRGLAASGRAPPGRWSPFPGEDNRPDKLSNPDTRRPGRPSGWACADQGLKKKKGRYPRALVHGPRRRRPHARRLRPGRGLAARAGAAGRGRRLRLGRPVAARRPVGGQGAEGRGQGRRSRRRCWPACRCSRTPSPCRPWPMPQEVAEDYRTTSLSLKAHPVRFFRPMLDRLGSSPAEQLKGVKRRPQGLGRRGWC